MFTCEMCGEDIDSNVCPFCETVQGLEPEINIPSLGRPKQAKVDNRLLAAINPNQKIHHTHCQMCGEEIDSIVCPFCETVQEVKSRRPSRKQKSLKSVNIKDDLPLVDEALSRLEREIDSARRSGYKALKVIHGYGSSGRGGVIKEEVHRVIRRMYINDDIHDWIPGEDFSAEYSETLETLKNNRYLESDEDFRNNNRGISIIIF
ncbi:MAG: Smr/MutS family protein [Lentisphaeraceae bacterium]|nr:Smr/MutS family protein [Lentisphaeraceae bacterium]